MAELHNYLVVGAVLFALGAIGFLTRRNLIMMALSAEMMLHGVSLNLVAFSQLHGNNEGQAFAMFIVTVAACEAGIAWRCSWPCTSGGRRWMPCAGGNSAKKAFRRTRRWKSRRIAPIAPRRLEFPHLTPAGRVPEVPKRRAPDRV